MATALITHIDCLDHVTPSGHPEQVARLAVIQEALGAPQFASLQRHAAALGTDAQILLAHPAEHLTAIKSAQPPISLDADTHMSLGSLTAALRGVGGICQAVDLVLGGQADNAFCATRPPGHHAEKTKAMGFCLFGHVSIGAKYALEQHGLDRVAIVDFDVHHGNGTQDLCWDDARILFASTHQMPLYPGTGEASETGQHGTILNVPIAPNSDGRAILNAFEQHIFPALEAHAPQALFLSAGFDAHCDDPLANLNLTTQDFADITERLCDFAQDHCQGRVISTLEGGYDLPALAESVSAHVAKLMEYAQ